MRAYKRLLDLTAKTRQCGAKKFNILIRGGVFEDVRGLEDTFWSPWSWPRRSSPWPRGLKPSKIAVLGSRTALFFEWLKFCRSASKFFSKPFFFGDRLKNFLKTFFFGKGLKKVLEIFFLNTCVCVLGPWPRAFLSLASRVFVLGKAVLGLGLGFFFGSLPLASSFVSSTPPLILILSNGSENVQNFFKAWLKLLFLLTHYNELTKSTLRLGVPPPPEASDPHFPHLLQFNFTPHVECWIHSWNNNKKKKRLCKPSLSKAKYHTL